MLILPIYFEYDYKKKEQDFNTEIWNKIEDINLKLPLILMNNANKILNKGSSIVNLVSTDYLWGSYISKYYSSIMSAKVSLIKSFSNYWGNLNIRCNGVGAGWIESVIDKNSYSEDLINLMKSNTPTKSLIKPKEVANAIEFLISDNSKCINGQILNIDRGYSNVENVTRMEYEKFIS